MGICIYGTNVLVELMQAGCTPQAAHLCVRYVQSRLRGEVPKMAAAFVWVDVAPVMVIAAVPGAWLQVCRLRMQQVNGVGMCC